MKKEEVKTDNAPKAIGPYSQAIKFGNLIFCSGQIAVDPKTNKLVYGGIKEQTIQVFRNLEGLLVIAGGDLDTVLKVTIYLDSMDDFPIVNKIYADYFTKPYPVRATVEVNRLPKDALIEVECIAYIC